MTEKKTINFKPFVLIFIVIITLIIAIQIFGAARFETILAAQAEVVDGFWAEALIVRDEKVITSPISGRVKLMVGEGDRLATGKKLAEIKSANNNQKIFNQKAGLVSFAVDGLETKVNLDNLNKLNLQQFEKLNGHYKQLLSGDKIAEGDPLYRIVNNFKLFIIVKVPKTQLERFRINELIFLEQKNSEELFEARIVDIRQSLEHSFFQIEIEQFVPEWINRRKIKLNIIKNIYRGIKIPKKAVFNQPSGRGVLKVTGYNKYEFKKIKILNGNDHSVIVDGLEVGEEIITNPEDFNYGREV